MQVHHLTIRRTLPKRLLSAVLSVLLCFSLLPAFAGTVSAEDAAPPMTQTAASEITPGARFSVERSADGASVSVTLQLRGTALARTQCAAIAFDASVLALPGVPLSALAPSVLTTLPDLSAFSFPPASAADTWYFDGTLSAEAGRSTDGKTGYLVVYPTQYSTVTYSDWQPAVTVTFRCAQNAILSASSVRLLTYTEQSTLLQSVKLALCTPAECYTFGSLAGGDRTEDPAFVGNTPVTGSRGADLHTPDTPWVNHFTDVSETDPYYDAVSYVCRSRLFLGTSQTTFEPLAPMTRASFATVLCRLAGAEDAVLADTAHARDVAARFTDIDPDAWYAPYVAWGVDSGLFLGYGNGQFGPHDPINHEQMYTLIHRYSSAYRYGLGSGAAVSLSSLADFSEISDWAVDSIRFAFSNGLLIVDATRTARPKQQAARWELATLLQMLPDVRRASSAVTVSASAQDYMDASSADNDVPSPVPAGGDMLENASRKIFEGLITLSDQIGLSAYGITVEQLRSVYQQVIKQPEFFYVANAYNYSYSTTTGYVVSVSPSYTMRGETLVNAQKFVQSRLDAILSGVSAEWSDYEKVLYLHDYLITHFVCDEDSGIADVYRFLTGGRGVCQAYTLTYEALLGSLGIPFSRAVSVPMNHTWNIVGLDGAWYHVDVTWDDPVNDQYGQAQHTYFLCSDAYMMNNRHFGWTADVSCTSSRYDGASWRTVRTPFVPFDNGLWYYADNVTGTVYGMDPATGRLTRAGRITGRWTTDEGVFQSLYTGLVRCGDVLLYNTPDAVCALHPLTGVSETLFTRTGKGLICGIMLPDGAFSEDGDVCTVCYCVRSSPADRTGAEYRLQLQLSGSFTYSLGGTLSGYFSDAQITVRLYKNGTLTKTAEIPRAQSFLCESAAFRIDGIRPGTYSAVIEKDGCFPCRITELSIDKNTDLTALLKGHVLLSGDVNGDGLINQTDAALLVRESTFHCTAAQAAYPAADINGDSRIDFMDYAILTASDRMGKTAADGRIRP